MNYLKFGLFSGLMLVIVSTLLALYSDVFLWEIKFTLWLQQIELGKFGFIHTWIFFMGIRGVAGILMIVFFVLLWFRDYRVEAISVALISIPDILNIFVREIINRPRPNDGIVEVVIGYGGIQGHGFPSGHALHVVLFYGFLTYLLVRHTRKSIYTFTLSLSTTLYIFITGLWLIYDGRHWALDVIGGYFYGLVFLFILITGYEFVKSMVATKHLT